MEINSRNYPTEKMPKYVEATQNILSYLYKIHELSL